MLLNTDETNQYTEKILLFNNQLKWAAYVELGRRSLPICRIVIIAVGPLVPPWFNAKIGGWISDYIRSFL